MVGEKLIDSNVKIRGALCAQSFSGDVLKDILDINSTRGDIDKIVAVKIYRFPVNNDSFIFVERLVWEEKSITGGPQDYYTHIPLWKNGKLEIELYKLLENRKINYPMRFQQLRVFLEYFVNDPYQVVSQEELDNQWKLQGLPEQDQGMSVSQVLGYKNSGSLMQILTWDTQDYTLIKNNYRLKEAKYSKIIEKVLKKI